MWIVSLLTNYLLKFTFSIHCNKDTLSCVHWILCLAAVPDAESFKILEESPLWLWEFHNKFPPSNFLNIRNLFNILSTLSYCIMKCSKIPFMWVNVQIGILTGNCCLSSSSAVELYCRHEDLLPRQKSFSLFSLFHQAPAGRMYICCFQRRRRSSLRRPEAMDKLWLKRGEKGEK